MTPEQIDRVFGRGRLRMVTGEHVEVFREAAAPGERRRYTKRFLATQAGDFREWTEREWRILARLVGHGVRCVPEVVRFDRGSVGGTAMVQTYDAGITVDHWATLLPVERDGRVFDHVFEDCAHWWALAHHGLKALHEIHQLQLVHLDVKADNVCIPPDPFDFSPEPRGQLLRPRFGELALIDFAFSLVSGESLSSPLPIGWQSDYAYQSPRLLAALEAGRRGDLVPTQQLDWRCDLFSLAAMLERYLPVSSIGRHGDDGWTPRRHARAQGLLGSIRDAHDRAGDRRPHPQLIEFSAAPLRDRDLAQSLQRGWRLAERERPVLAHAPPTPVTRLALPLGAAPEVAASPAIARPVAAPRSRRLRRLVNAGLVLGGTFAVGYAVYSGYRVAADAVRTVADAGDSAVKAVRSVLGMDPPPPEPAPERPPRQARPERPAVPAPGPKAQDAEEGFAERADRLLRASVPRLAAQAEGDVSRVLAEAGAATYQAADAEVARAAIAIRAVQGEAPVGPSSIGDARMLNEQARNAFWNRRAVKEAVSLQLRAFGANPRDTEVAGNLAFYLLKLDPPRAETSRQLALYALATGSSAYPTGRIEDWGTLAVASALTGRENDAINAMLAMLALSKNLERTCRAGLSAAASFGQPMRAPTEAVLRRLQARGQAQEVASCRWPPDWGAGTRFP